MLDGLMTNCLFSMNIFAVTARLEVRYLHTVEISQEIHLTAQHSKSKGVLHYVKAELLQRGQVKAKASGSFIDRPLHSTV